MLTNLKSYSLFENPAILFSLLRAIGVMQLLFASWSNVIAHKTFAFSVCDDIDYDFRKKSIKKIVIVILQS